MTSVPLRPTIPRLAIRLAARTAALAITKLGHRRPLVLVEHLARLVGQRERHLLQCRSLGRVQVKHARLGVQRARQQLVPDQCRHERSDSWLRQAKGRRQVFERDGRVEGRVREDVFDVTEV